MVKKAKEVNSVVTNGISVVTNGISAVIGGLETQKLVNLRAAAKALKAEGYPKVAAEPAGTGLG